MKTITLCGSMTFWNNIENIKSQLEQNGFMVLTPSKEGTEIDYNAVPHNKQIEMKKVFIDRHIERIKQSDIVLILNYDKKGIQNYIGANTFIEMAFAYILGKKIFLLNPVPTQDNSLEIEALKPIILSGDLSKINIQ